MQKKHIKEKINVKFSNAIRNLNIQIHKNRFPTAIEGDVKNSVKGLQAF